MSARMTPAQIRRATPFPKPKGAIAKAWLARGGVRSTPRERTLLRHIVQYGDVIDIDRPVLVDGGAARGRWLLVPLPLDMLDELAEFESRLADPEPGSDEELELGWTEAIDQNNGREQVDGEGNLGAPERVSQLGWSAGDRWGHEIEPNLGSLEKTDQRHWGASATDDREDDPAEHGEIEQDIGEGEDEPQFAEPLRTAIAQLHGAPVYDANHESRVTDGTTLGEWRRL
jgi:hypothetical protein